MSTEKKFEQWCIVELFGHSRIAGKCTEENIAGTNMLRVDVPETKSQPAFTRYFGSGAIYAINPVDEKNGDYRCTKPGSCTHSILAGRSIHGKMDE